MRNSLQNDMLVFQTIPADSMELDEGISDCTPENGTVLSLDTLTNKEVLNSQPSHETKQEQPLPDLASYSTPLASVKSDKPQPRGYSSPKRNKKKKTVTNDDDVDDVMDLVAREMQHMRAAMEEEEEQQTEVVQKPKLSVSSSNTCCDLRWLHSSGPSIAPMHVPRPNSPNQSVFLSYTPLSPIPPTPPPFAPDDSKPKPKTSSSEQGPTWTRMPQAKESKNVNLEKLAAQIWSQPSSPARRLSGVEGPHGRIIRRSNLRSVSWSQTTDSQDPLGSSSDGSSDEDSPTKEMRRRRREELLFGRRRRRNGNSCCETEAEFVLTLMASSQALGYTFPAVPTSAARSGDLEKLWKEQDRTMSHPHSSPNLLASIGPIPKQNRACSFLLKGRCRKEDCQFAHDLSQVTCRFWQAGDCFKGLACPFLHGYPAVTNPNQQPKKTIEVKHASSEIDLHRMQNIHLDQYTPRALNCPVSNPAIVETGDYRIPSGPRRGRGRHSRPRMEKRVSR